MKKTWLAGLVVVILPILVACGGTTPTTPTATTPTTTTPTTTTPTATTPKTTTPMATTPTAGGPPALPADHLNPPRTQCLICHTQGVGGAPKIPTALVDHTNFSDANNAALCLGCHKPAS